MRRTDARPFGTLAALLGGLAGLVLFGIWLEESARRANLAQIRQTLHQSSLSLGQHAADMIEVAELTLAVARAGLLRQDDAGGVQMRLAEHMDDTADHARHIARLIYVDREGKGTASRMNDGATSIDAADLPYFRYHRDDPSTEALLGAPMMSPVSGERVIPVSLRLEGPDQRFIGVLAAEMRVDAFSTLFQRLAWLPGGLGAVALNDGRLLALFSSTPVSGQFELPWAEVIAPLARAAPGGVVQSVWEADGLSRHTAVRYFDHPAITVVTAATDEAISARWFADSKLRLFVGALLIGVGLLVTLRWWRQVGLHMESLRQLKRMEEEFRLLAEASADLIEKLSLEGVREYVSPASIQILGLPPERLIGTNVLDTLPPEERERGLAALANLRHRAETHRSVIRYICPDGRERWLETAISRLDDNRGRGTGLVAITRDITQQKLHTEELDALAHTDGLTGLSNRRAFDAQLQERRRAARESGQPLTMLMIDVDRFKLYNDSYGHAAGDTCLKEVASAIARSIRRTDFAARYGGEEFAVLIDAIDQEAAVLIAEKIRKRVASRRSMHDRNIPWGYVTVSIGIADWQPGSARDIHSLVENADAALYAAKERRNCVRTHAATGGLGSKLSA